MEIRPIRQDFAAGITGLDLCRDIDTATVRSPRRAMTLGSGSTLHEAA